MNVAIYLTAMGAAVYSLRRPNVGIYLLIVLLPLQTIRYDLQQFPQGSRIIDVLLGCVILGALLHKKGPLFADLPMKRLLLVFSVYLYLSLWYGSYRFGLEWPISPSDVRVSQWKALVEMPLVYAAAFVSIRNLKQIKRVVLLMLVTALVIGFMFYQDMQVHEFTQFTSVTEGARGSGVMGYAGANGLGAFEAGFTLFLLGLYGRGLSRLLKVGILFGLLACAYGVMYSFSRGAYLAIPVGILFIGFARNKKKLLLPLLLILVLGAGVVMPSVVTSRVSGTFVQAQGSDSQQLEGSAEKRVLILQTSVPYIEKYPLMGTGFLTYQLLHPVAGLKDTHDYYLRILFETGIIGLAMFGAILWQMLCRSYRLFRQSPDPFLSSLGLGLGASMVGAAVVNFFGDRWSYQQVGSYWWILLAMVCRAQLLSAKPGEELGPESEALPAMVPSAELVPE